MIKKYALLLILTGTAVNLYPMSHVTNFIGVTWGRTVRAIKGETLTQVGRSIDRPFLEKFRKTNLYSLLQSPTDLEKYITSGTIEDQIAKRELLENEAVALDSDMTPVHAALCVSEKATEVLLNNGFSVSSTSDQAWCRNGGDTRSNYKIIRRYDPIKFAIHHEDHHGIKTLLRHGADINKSLGLHWAAQWNKTPNTIKYLLDNGANPTLQAHQWINVFWQHSKSDLKLVENMPNPTAKDVVLHGAVIHNMLRPSALKGKARDEAIRILEDAEKRHLSKE